MAKKSKASTAAAAAAAEAPDAGVSSPQGGGGGGEKEGSFLLGPPTWVDAGGGRWRCAETGHELPEREKEAYGRSRACRLALIDHAVARKRPPLNAFKPHPEHKSKLICNITGDIVNKSEEHVWKHINGKRFLNKLEKLEEKMASGEMAEGENEQSNEVAKKTKSSKKKDKKKAAVVNPSLPREPKPEIDDSDNSDDPDFWVPPVGSRWDDDDGKDRWGSLPVKDDAADDEDGDDDNDGMADKDDEETREIASRTKRLSVEAVGPSSFASRKKKPKKDHIHGFFLLLLVVRAPSLAAAAAAAVQCPAQQAAALLRLKRSFHHQDQQPPLLPSWRAGNATGCCHWEGVSCDDDAGGGGGGGVTALDLTGRGIHSPGDLDTGALSQLTSLRRLSLAGNDFGGAAFPATGLADRLTHLNLSGGGFAGQISAGVGGLRELVSLDLSNNGFNGSFPLGVFKLERLRVLDVSTNSDLAGVLPEFAGGISQLEVLDLSATSFSGRIPSSIGNLKRLKELDLSSSNGRFSGALPDTIGDLSSLSFLDLSSSGFQLGELPDSIGRMQSLSTLRLRECSISGEIPLSIVNLTRLRELDLSQNNLTGPITTIDRKGAFLNLEILQLCCNSLSGPVPGFLFSLPRLEFISLMLNSLADYSNNLFSSIPEELAARLNNSFFLSLANNSLHGGISPIICNARNLKLLDLSYNHFSGPVPSCLLDGHLTVLKLRNNKFEGTLPDDIKEGCVSQTIDLNGNQMEGKLPRSLTNCNDLEVFDVGNNSFADSFPSWIGELPKLRVLVLRSNKLFGAVGGTPVDNGDRNRTQFSSLQIIDLASNNFSGILPLGWFENLKAMMVTRKDDLRQALEDNLSGKFYRDTVVVTYKGATMTFSRILITFTAIDFSDNAFTGNIPESIGRLASLRGLNLSHNAFTGTIPSEFSGLAQLESLDLSLNQLDGEIPDVLISLTSIGWLNLSFNHLEGAIPQGGQFQTFGSSSFEGNAALCGKPLSIQCNSPNAGFGLDNESSEARTDTIVLYLAVGLGFGLGFSMAILFQCSGGIRSGF
uniref:non-specific serine/threonine protein kinase n=1 Tax=Leersia perrieri TaxID=77586 RepID=A0A0D9W6A1_9ORYZ